jgi:hypothetical protein
LPLYALYLCKHPVGQHQRYRTDLIQTSLQRAIEQSVKFVQLTQRDFNGAHRTIPFEDTFTILVVVIRLGTQVCSANVFLRYLVLFKEGDIAPRSSACFFAEAASLAATFTSLPA